MNRDKLAIERATLPELVFFDGENTLYSTLEEIDRSDEKFETGELFDILKPLLRPEIPYDAYARDDPITLDQYKELAETGLSPLDLVYHYLLHRMKAYPPGTERREAMLADIQLPLVQFINESPAVFKLNADLPDDYFNEIRLKAFSDEYEKKKREFLARAAQREKPREAMDKISDELRPVSQTVIKSFLVFPCETGKDVLEYFNEARVSSTIPYVTCSPYSKLFQNSKLYSKWNTSNPNSLIGYARWADDERETSYSQFELTPSTLTIESRQKDLDAQRPARDLLEKISRCVEIDIPVKDGKEVVQSEELFVECFYAGIDIHPWLFKQFLYTDSVMRHFYFIDESQMLLRRRGFITLYYYPDPLRRDVPPVVIAISNLRPDLAERQNLSSEQCHTRVYLRRCTRQQIEPSLRDLGRCLLRFQQQRAALGQELLRVSGDEMLNAAYREECRPIESKKKREKVDFSSFFRERLNIRSLLQNKPTLLETLDTSRYYLINPEDGDVKRESDDTSLRQAIIFPAKKDADKLRQYYYTCDHEAHPFIGLTKKEELNPPYIPNCFITDHTSNPNSYLNRYYYGKGDAEEISSSYVITTGKMLSHRQVGGLLEWVQRWSRLRFPVATLYRYGLLDYASPASPTYVPPEGRHASVLYIMDYMVNGLTDFNLQARKAQLLDYIRQSNAHLTETYRYNTAELEDILLGDSFIDPRLFYHVLRDMYGVELLLFTKDEARSKSPFYPCPPYYNSSESKKERALMLAINKGGEFDNLAFPVCEPVFWVKEGESLTQEPKRSRFVTKTASVIYEAAMDTFGHLYGKQEIRPVFRGRLREQTLDSFGRVSWLHMEGVSIMLKIPTHSMDLPLREGDEFTNNEQTARDFLTREGLRYTDTRDGTGRLMAFVTERYVIPVGRPPKDDSFEKYKQYEKVSRYLVEYICLLFSMFIQNVDKVSYEHFQAFAEQKIVIRARHQYPLTSRQWSPVDPAYAIGDRLIVPNQTMKTKLMYLLRQRFRTNQDVLRGYHLLEYMPNYYASIADFTPQPKTLLLDKINEIKQPSQGLLHVNPVAEGPYMMYRELSEFSHTVWLCQPARSLAHAVWIAQQWRQTQANPMGDGESELPHAKVVWSSLDTYQIYAGDPSRIVSVIPTEEGIRYQALLPYRVG
jgi:hypothetical protein